MNSGYSGYSMSNRAVDAYEDGEMPLSKWTKKMIISEVVEHEHFTEEELKSILKMFLQNTFYSKAVGIIQVLTATRHISIRLMNILQRKALLKNWKKSRNAMHQKENQRKKLKS